MPYVSNPQGFSNGASLPPRGLQEMTGNICWLTKFGKLQGRGQSAAKHPKMYKAGLYNKILSSPKSP